MEVKTAVLVLSFLLIGFIATTYAAEACKNHNKWCHYMTRYGACSWNNDTKKTCPRSCGECQVTCTDVTPNERKECGYFGISQQDCYHEGCCWKPLAKDSKFPWCYKPAATAAVKCEDLSGDCKYHTRYGACNFNKFTQDNCKKSCKLC